MHVVRVYFRQGGNHECGHSIRHWCEHSIGTREQPQPVSSIRFVLTNARRTTKIDWYRYWSTYQIPYIGTRQSQTNGEFSQNRTLIGIPTIVSMTVQNRLGMSDFGLRCPRSIYNGILLSKTSVSMKHVQLDSHNECAHLWPFSCRERAFTWHK